MKKHDGFIVSAIFLGLGITGIAGAVISAFRACLDGISPNDAGTYFFAIAIFVFGFFLFSVGQILHSINGLRDDLRVLYKELHDKRG